MATTLLVRGEDITRNTILNSNIDKSKFQNDVKTAQNLMIKPVLGKELYDVICQMYENTINGVSGGLTGSYYTLYEDYIKEMVIHSSTEIYLGHGAYTISNSGISKMVSQQGATSVDKNEVDFLIQSSRRLYESYKEDMIKWLRENPIPEYNNTCSSSVTRKNNIGGWIL